MRLPARELVKVKTFRKRMLKGHIGSYYKGHLCTFRIPKYFFMGLHTGFIYTCFEIHPISPSDH